MSDRRPIADPDAARAAVAAPEVLTDVYRAEGRQLWRFLAHLTGDREGAEAAFADAFAGLVRHGETAPTSEPVSSSPRSSSASGRRRAYAAAGSAGADGSRKGLTTRLYRIAVHLSTSQPDTRSQNASETAPTERAEPAFRALTDKLEQALAQVELADRAPFLLARLLGLSFADIAEILSTSCADVRVRIARAHRRLTAILRRTNGASSDASASAPASRTAADAGSD